MIPAHGRQRQADLSSGYLRLHSVSQEGQGYTVGLFAGRGHPERDRIWPHNNEEESCTDVRASILPI